MKKDLVYFLASSGILLAALTGCTRQENRLKPEYLEGKWSLPVNSGRYAGTDTISFGNNGKFNDSKGVIYSGTDSGFEFSLRLDMSASGSWGLKGDTLYVVYAQGAPSLEFHKNSFKIKATSAGADNAALANVRDEMYECLCNNLRDSIQLNFKGLSADTVFFGRITNVTTQNMTITRDDGRVTLNRISR